MHLTFLFLILIVELLHYVLSTDVPFWDMNIPDDTSGFLCDNHYFRIGYIRSSAQEALTKFLRRSSYHQFPAFFENTHAFGIADQILLSWPLVKGNKVYTTGTVGNYRVIINTGGQVIGVIAITDLYELHPKLNFRKCAPVHISDEQHQDNSISGDLLWDYVYPVIGYICDLKFLEISQVNYVQRLIVKPEFQQELRDTSFHKYVEGYTGNIFTGNELKTYKVQKLDKNGYPNGRPGSFRVVFNLAQGFMGVINVDKGEGNCVKVWDLTQSPHGTYNPNSHVFDGIVPGMYTPYFCLNQELKSEIIQQQAYFFTRQLNTESERDDDMYPIMHGQYLILWPLRLPESNIRLKLIFALGLNLNTRTFNVYYSSLRRGFNWVQPCGVDFTI
ncbi:unnamed protein product [Blumeria hordei]|uniref:Candidate secreted effector protein n=1 Tax=Blumeria hordei TaxID=2867405 RepID=A0A383UQN9_BLUHO|nr:unnamed protein product [Blumeria hordei]